MTPTSRSLLVILALALGGTASFPARAQDTTVDPPAPPPALLVQLELAHSGLDAETVRQAIESELGVPVRLVDVADQATLAVRVDARHRATAVAKTNEDRVERKIDLPTDGAQATESIAWLAGNLARDEAAELIAALRVEPEPAPVETPPEEPKKEEPPASPAPAPPKPAPKAAAKESPPKPADGDTGPAKDERFPFDKRRPVNLTLVHPLALFPDADQRTLLIEFGLGYSVVGALRGVGFNPGVLRVRGPVRGLAASFGFTQTGAVEGAALSLGATYSERVQGAELGVGASIAGGDIEGAQLALGASVARGSVEGVQLAAGANVNTETVRGAQLAIGANFARDLSGAQIGLVNIGKNVNGLQFGLVNVADELDGVSLGLVNITRRTRLQGVAWASREEYANVGVKLITGYIYTELGGGYRFDSKEAASHCGIGPHFQMRSLYLEPGLHYSQGYGTRETGGVDSDRWQDFIYRLTLGWDVAQGFGIFGGAGVRQPLIGPDYDVSMTYFAGITLFGAPEEPARTARR